MKLTAVVLSIQERMDVVFCKSRHCVALMKAFRHKHGPRKQMQFKIYYTNHTSLDMRQQAPESEAADDYPAYKRFVHVAGKSIFKNTDAVLACWRANPAFPRLKVVVWGLVLKRLQRAHRDWFDGQGRPQGWPNVDFITERLPEPQIKTLLNRSALLKHGSQFLAAPRAAENGPCLLLADAGCTCARVRGKASGTTSTRRGRSRRWSSLSMLISPLCPPLCSLLSLRSISGQLSALSARVE